MQQDVDDFIKSIFKKDSVFEGKYRIKARIGTGNFSHVFLAHHESMGRDVAIKVLKPEMKKRDPELTARFLNEVKIVSRLRHPNTVTIFDFGETQHGINYMVLEYIAGIDLDELLEQKKRFSVKYATHLILQILSALEEAHWQNIIHRDLKPSNIMIGNEGTQKIIVKVLDFGVAKFIDKRKPSTPETQRKSTKFIGTPVYMSPEQVLGQHVSPSSDLYSVGLLLYELLTGDVPVVAKNLAGVARIHIDEAPIPFKKINAIPESLASIILKATQRFPEQRFVSAKDFSHALLTALGTEKPYKRSEDVSASTRAFFLEREADVVPLIAPGKDEKNNNQRAKRVKRPTIPAPAPKIKSKSDATLELDYQKARAVDRRTRQSPLPLTQVGKNKNYLSIMIGGLALLLSSYLVGTLIPAESASLRFMGALIPITLAIFATIFSPHARRASGPWIEQWLEPILQKSTLIFGVILTLSFLFFSENAALEMRDNASWFFPEFAQNSGFTKIVNFIGLQFSAVFSAVSQLLPW